MINKRITIPYSSLNTGDVVLLEESEIILIKTEENARGKVFERKWFPNEFQIINDTGDDVFFNYLSNYDEYRAYKNNPSEYELIRVPNNTVLQDDFGSNILLRFILISGVNGGAANKDLVVELIDYHRTRIK